VSGISKWVVMRRPIVDFYHLFDEDELFPRKIVLIVKKFRLAIGMATVNRSPIELATVITSAIGMTTIKQQIVGLATKRRSKLAIATTVRKKTSG